MAPFLGLIAAGWAAYIFLHLGSMSVKIALAAAFALVVLSVATSGTRGA